MNPKKNDSQAERPVVLLAVDDREDNLFVLRQLVEDYLPGIEVKSTTDPVEGLEMARRIQPDVLLLDVRMPGMGGIRMCKKLKADERTARIPVILITAYRADPSMKAEGLEAGADDFLAKPLDQLELVSKIKVMLRIKHAEDRLREVNKNLEQRIEEELKKRSKHEKALMQQSKLAAMGEMVGAIAHQWRQPITTVGVILQNIKMAYKLDKLDLPTLEKYNRDAMEQIKFMSRTIDDFRNFFKPSRAKETFSPVKTVQETISLMRAQLESDSISINLVCRETAPDRVSGYPNEFKQVLVNIINNAGSAIREQREKELIAADAGDIFLDISGNDGDMVLEIANNGGKIPNKIMNRIFEPFFTTRADEKGMGIGLYMCKTIIENQMNGHIYANNGKDGAVFTIRLEAGN